MKFEMVFSTHTLQFSCWICVRFMIDLRLIVRFPSDLDENVRSVSYLGQYDRDIIELRSAFHSLSLRCEKADRSSRSSSIGLRFLYDRGTIER